MSSSLLFSSCSCATALLLFVGVIADAAGGGGPTHVIHTGGITSPNVTERLALPGDVTYFVAALEVSWSYCPDGTNPLDGGAPVDESESSAIFTKNGEDRIGQTYRKAVYREFTDASFSTQVARDARWTHLGVLGPVIRATVGQRIKIVFLNNCSDSAYSMHPHGVAYDKTSEGAVYVDGTPGFGDAIEPFQMWVYFWDVRTETAGSQIELSSKLWLYHSHVHEPADTNAGLVGPIIITQDGSTVSASDLRPADVDREFVTLFNVFDENESQFLEQNMVRFIPNVYEQNASYIAELMADDDFVESNLMHSMNGYMFGVLGRFYADIKLGERVRWYVGAMGSEIDLHTAHWHGNVVHFEGRYSDVVPLLPAITLTMDMEVDRPGVWFYHCHVNDHIEAGMMASYTVLNQSVDTTTSTADPDTTTTSGGGAIVIDNTKNEFTWKETWRTIAIALVLNLAILALIGVAICLYRKCRPGFNDEMGIKLTNYGTTAGLAGNT